MKVKVTFDDLEIFVPEERVKKWRMEAALELAKEGKVPCTQICVCRSPTCHSECEAYLLFHEKNLERHKKHMKETDILQYIKEQVELGKRK